MPADRVKKIITRNDFPAAILKSVVTFLLAVACGFGLICAMYALPTERTCLHVRESGESLELEGDYYQLLPGNEYTRLDNFTDAIMLLTASYNGSEGIVDKAVNNYRVYVKDQTKAVSCKMCGLTMDEKDLKINTYSRYWHGYIVVLKPMLLFLNLTEIRQLNLLVIIAELTAAGILMYRKKLTAYVIPFIVSIAFLNPMTVSASLQNSTVFHITMAAVILELLFWEYKIFRSHIYLFFLCIGMVTSYMDFLTYPIVTLGYPLIFYFILESHPKVLENFRRLLQYSLLWCIGYAGMWASKWVIATMVTGTNYIEDGIAKIIVRSGGDIGGETEITAVDIYRRMWEYFSKNSIRHILLLILVIEIAAIVIRKIRFRKWAVSLAIGSAALYPFVWYGLVKNHSIIHVMFTYRGMSLLIMGAASLLLPNVLDKASGGNSDSAGKPKAFRTAD